MSVINSFQGEHRFLSNFFPSPIRWWRTFGDDVIFPTVEHGFVWFKTTDEDLRSHILTIPTPGQVKRFGRTLELRPNWDTRKLFFMRELVHRKFVQNHDLRDMLLDTGDSMLIEGNRWHDQLWGVCFCGKC